MRTCLCIGLLCCTAMLCSFVTAAGRGGYSEIEIQKPFRSPSLSGMVVDQSGALIPDVSVEECQSGWNSCVQFSTTNANGRFGSRGKKYGKHFLRFQAPGFDPLLVVVIVNPLFLFAKVPHLRLEVAT